MNILGKNGLGNLLKIILICSFIIGIPLIIIMPFLLNHVNNVYASMFIIYPNGILMLGIVYQFIKLFKSLEDNNPFNYTNVKIMKVTGIISFIMSILWIIDLLFMIFIMHNMHVNYIIVLIFLGVLFFGVSIALYILSELLREATVYKDENYLTI